MPIATAITKRTCTGTAVWPNKGAAKKAAPGRIAATSSSHRLVSTPAKAGGSMGGLTYHVGNAREHVAREIAYQPQHRASEQDQAETDQDQFGDERKRGLVDRC